MANTNNTGYGVKISQLNWATNINALEDYTVLVQEKSGNLETKRAKISELLESAGNSSIEMQRIINELAQKVKTNTDDIIIINQDLSLITGNYDSNFNSINSNIASLNNSIYGYYDNQTYDYHEGINDRIQTISATLLGVSGPLSDLISDPNMISGLSVLIQKYGNSELSDDIIAAQEKIKILSADISSLEIEIENNSKEIQNLKDCFDALNKKINGNLFDSNRQRLTTTKTYNYSLFNPINAEIINDSYEYYDKYCFANTPVFDENPELSDDGYEILSGQFIDDTVTYYPMPGSADFDLDAIPLRAGMFNVENNNAVLELKTKGNSTVLIYLNDSSFDSSNSFKTNVYINYNKVHSNTNSSVSQNDMRLVWNGELNSKSSIRFEVPLTGNATFDQHKLIGAIVPRLNLSENTPIRYVSILSAYYEPGVQTTFIVDYGINDGYSGQEVPLSLIFNGGQTVLTSMVLGDFPRINYLDRGKYFNANPIAGISSVQLVAYDEISKETISSDVYEL